MTSNPIATNLRRLRSSRGMTQEDLAKKAKLSRIAYSNVENGKANPRVNNLQQIADALDVGIQELVTPVPTIKSLRFRAKKMPTGHAKNSRDQILADVAFWLRDYSGLEAGLSKQRVNKLKGIKANNPKEYALRAREALGLKPNEPINDICGLVEHAGIKIKLLKTDLDQFNGLSALDQNNNPAIVVKSEGISVERQIFTVAHELGHIVMHQDSFDGGFGEERKKEEDEANQFASYFLMSKEAFDRSWDENKGLHWLQSILHIKRIYKISYRTVINRLIEDGIDKEKIWEAFNIAYHRKYGGDLKNHKEPCPLDPLDFVEDRLSALTKEALEKSVISVSRAAEILDLSLEEMRDLINSWSLVNESASV